MKQIKIFIAIAIFSALNFTQVSAADTGGTSTNLPVELKSAGTIKTQPLLQLNFNGSTADNVFRVVITDGAGIELYNAEFKGTVFSKQFLLNTEDLGDAVLHFEITGKKSGLKALYQVNRERQVTQQMDIVKL